MNIDPKYLEVSFESVGIRNSQKRLKGLIAEVAVQPIKEYENELLNNFDLVEAILLRRISHAITYWCQNKHDPTVPRLSNMMSQITNASKNDLSLEDFYTSEVKYAMYSLGPTLGLNVPADYEPSIQFFADALAEIGNNQPELMQDDESDYAFDLAMDYDDNDQLVVDLDEINLEGQFTELAELVTYDEAKVEEPIEPERAIVASDPTEVIEVPEQAVQSSVLPITAEEAWHLIYGLIGYPSEYIQETMLPRWHQHPEAFDKDRRFLYGLFIDTIRNASGLQHIAGNYTFSDRNASIDQLWTHYFADLSQNVAPMLAAARLDHSANDPWYRKLGQKLQKELGNFSAIWLIALGIALIFDGLTTYISLDQTPMEGPMVLMFTILITALFQIADQLVISYRKKEFEAEAMAAKFHAQYEGLTQTVENLPITSESYVQLSMNKSQSHADWKAAEDNRKMARRGRFWSARIADINVIVTAYGFSYMFLNAREPMFALVQQVENITANAWDQVDPWVFLMVGLAVTVSFVVNTAQRTEILGWSMRRMKKEA